MTQASVPAHGQLSVAVGRDEVGWRVPVDDLLAVGLRLSAPQVAGKQGQSMVSVSTGRVYRSPFGGG